MSTKKSYYLIIPIKDVFVKVKKNDIISADTKMATEIFNKYEIPAEYQKIILKTSIGGMSIPKGAFELTSNEPFCFKTSIIKAILNQDKENKLVMLSHNTEIISDVHIYHAEKMKEFYQGIIDNNLALNYEKAVCDVLGKSLKNENSIEYAKTLKKEY